MRSLLLTALLLAISPSVLACRELPQDMQFKVADVVHVGWISAAQAPELEALAPGSNDDLAEERSINSHRVFRLVVTETRKGPSVASQTVEVYRCTGAANSVGSRVIAYHFPDGTWRISPLPRSQDQDPSDGP